MVTDLSHLLDKRGLLSLEQAMSKLLDKPASSSTALVPRAAAREKKSLAQAEPTDEEALARLFC